VTLRLRNEEAATARYKGFAITNEWRLEGLTGEPLDGTNRRGPEVGLGPEQVVASQLQHLRDSNIERVYNFASARNKKVVGNLANFGEIVSSPPYKMVRPAIWTPRCTRTDTKTHGPHGPVARALGVRGPQ